MKEKTIEPMGTLAAVKPSASRIAGFDFARALAVIGMILVNFKVVMWDWSSGPQWLKTLMGVFDGRAAATFVVLAGTGIMMLSRKARESGDPKLMAGSRNLLLKRALFLFVVGLLYAPLWPADILHFYGLYLAVGAFLLYVPENRFRWGIGIVMTVSLAMIILLDYSKDWNFSTLTYLDFWTAEGMIRHMFFNGWHPVFPWLAFLFLGMWLGRQDVLDPRLRTKILKWASMVLVVVEVVAWVGRTFLFPIKSLLELEGPGLFFQISPIPPLPLYMFSGGATAVVVICLCIMLTEKYRDKKWLLPIVHTGQLALSLYVFHVIIGMGVLEEVAGLQKHSLAFVAVYGLGFSILSVVLSHFWRKKFKRGPLEWGMRKITG